MTTWYKDAVFYEIPVRSFQDSNGDGIGDIPGVTSRLDYLQWLGVDCLWLLPILDSPLRDGGYDVRDFRTIHPELGTVDDVADLLDQAHRRGIRVVSDLILNHTSDEHPWFQEARHPGSERRDWYVWSDTADRYSDARMIFLDFEDSNWTWDPVAEAYFWHRFYSFQPDLNYDNPEVAEAMLEVVRFWLDLGFDGFRLDATPYLYEREGTSCENLPETHAYLRKIRRLVEAEYGADRVLLSEANQRPQDVVQYFGRGDECHMNFHFPIMPRLYMGLARRHAGDVRAILDETPDIPEETQWAVFLRNHDELTLEMVTEEDRQFMWDFYAPDPAMRLNLGIRRRLAPLLGDDRRALELLNGLLLSLPGSPVLYYGDEIGMGDDYLLPDRDGVRTPMQWTDGLNAGFSEADASALPIPLVSEAAYAPAVRSVESQQADPGSILNWLREMLAVRRKHPEMGRGSFEILDVGNDAVLVFMRRYGDRATLVLANFSRETQELRIPGDRIDERSPVDAATGRPIPRLGTDPMHIHLGALEFLWLRLD
jgi:maltose alpha-D-glucosyltransferase/alpha-amylase